MKRRVFANLNASWKTWNWIRYIAIVKSCFNVINKMIIGIKHWRYTIPHTCNTFSLTHNQIVIRSLSCLYIPLFVNTIRYRCHQGCRFPEMSKSCSHIGSKHRRKNLWSYSPNWIIFHVRNEHSHFVIIWIEITHYIFDHIVQVCWLPTYESSTVEWILKLAYTKFHGLCSTIIRR